MAAGSPSLRGSWALRLAVAVVLGVVAVGCTGRGGGYLPPDTLFSERATFGFTFTCEDSNLKGPLGRLRIELSYTDHGASPLGGGFSIHGEPDALSPLEISALCQGENPPAENQPLIILGRFWLTSSPPARFADGCDSSKSSGVPLCRFEVIIKDHGDRGPSRGDTFAIRLSSATAPTSGLPAGTVFYSRAGILGGGNLEID